MTDKDIHDAFERMKPDEAARERMLKNILAAGTSAPPVHRKKRHVKTSLLLAAAVAAALSVMAAAYGTDFFGLWSIGMRDQEIYSPVEVEGVYVPSTRIVDMISMQGLSGSSEFMACAEWQDFMDSYVPEDDEEEPYLEEYSAYNCCDRAAREKLNELCEKYSLSLLGPMKDALEEEDLFNGLGLRGICGETGENTYEWGYYYEGGSFFFEGTAKRDGRVTDYQFNCAAKGYLSSSVLNVGDMNSYRQWEYKTENGVTLLLVLGPSKGLVIADTEQSFIVVNVLGDLTAGGFDMTPEDLETFAEMFDFTVVP